MGVRSTRTPAEQTTAKRVKGAGAGGPSVCCARADKTALAPIMIFAANQSLASAKAATSVRLLDAGWARLDTTTRRASLDFGISHSQARCRSR